LGARRADFASAAHRNEKTRSTSGSQYLALLGALGVLTGLALASADEEAG